jgi:protein phosphatase
MGSTLVALLCSEAAGVLANIGDCRAYLLRRGGAATVSQITEDHTYGHLEADAGDVPSLPERLVRWIDGRRDGRSPDITTWDLRAGDRFMLCSDGLSSYVPIDLVYGALSAEQSSHETADRLIAAAIDQGAPDNVTVVIVDVHQQSEHGNPRNA